MSLFRNAAGDIKDIPQERFDAWVAAGNPKATAWKPLVIDELPAFDPATQKVEFAGFVEEATQYRKTWSVVALTQAELDAIADATERLEVKAMREQIATDIQESIEDQAQAQAYIDLAAPTNAERNQEVQNSARRDKAAEQRFRRLARIARYLLKVT